VFWWLPNSPDFDDEVLWVNHVDIESDRRMLESFPDRRGYVLVWTMACEPELRPIESVSPGEAPPNFMAQPK
jgi:hypothetical protein